MEFKEVELLKRQFFSCVPLNKFKWPDSINNFDQNVQKEIVDATVNNDLCLKYPVKQSYKIAFLKSFINKLENSEVEYVNDEVYNTYCDAIACVDERSQMYYRHFIVNDENRQSTISIKESTNIISEGTTGLCSWKAAFSLAEWCILNKERIKGKSVLELGSGVGLTGLTVVNFCAPKCYCFSDCHPTVLKTLEENVELNLPRKKNSKVEILNLKWEDIGEVKMKQMDIDLVIAADVVYDRDTFETLAVGLKELCQNVSYAILAATVRNESTISEFINALEKCNLAYEEETAAIPHIFVQSDETPVRILKIFKAK